MKSWSKTPLLFITRKVGESDFAGRRRESTGHKVGSRPKTNKSIEYLVITISAKFLQTPLLAIFTMPSYSLLIAFPEILSDKCLRDLAFLDWRAGNQDEHALPF